MALILVGKKTDKINKKPIYDKRYWTPSGDLYSTMYMYIGIPSPDDNIIVGSIQERWNGPQTQHYTTEYQWGDRSTRKIKLDTGRSWTPQDGWDSYYKLYVYIKQYKYINPNEKVIIGGEFEHRSSNSAIYKGTRYQWGIRNLQKGTSKLIAGLMRIRSTSGDICDSGRLIFYVGYAPTKIDDRVKFNCCSGRYPYNHTTLCKDIGYKGTCINCDKVMNRLCVGSNDVICSCINSQIPRPECLDIDCTKSGYRTTTMKRDCGNMEYYDCRQLIDINKNENIKLDRSKFQQICGGEIQEKEKEKTDKKIIYTSKEKIILPEIIHNIIKEYNISDEIFILFIIMFIIIIIMIAQNKSSKSPSLFDESLITKT